MRELFNCLERAAILSGGSPIAAEHVMLGAAPPPQEFRFEGTLKELEREAIRQALRATDGHRKRAAERLGIGLRTLYDKLKEYKL